MTRLPNTAFHNNLHVAHGQRARTRGVVIHKIEGSASSAESWFKNPDAGGVGAHVIVGLKSVVQTTDLQNICWHAPGCNSEWIGFEHEGATADSKATNLSRGRRTQLHLSANRAAWVLYHYKLGKAKWGVNVKGHIDCPGSDHTDPGKGWPRTFYIFLVNRAYKRLVKTGKWA